MLGALVDGFAGGGQEYCLALSVRALDFRNARWPDVSDGVVMYVMLFTAMRAKRRSHDRATRNNNAKGSAAR